MKSFNDLYLEYDNEELEIKMALQSVINDEKVVNEAAKQYQMGKAQDLIYAEQQLARGAIFNTVHKTLTSNIKKRAKSRPVFDSRLRQALIRSKKLPDVVHKYQAHHIIAKGDIRAKAAIAILTALGIDIDDPANGVLLPASEADRRRGALKKAYVHNTVHTKAYHANVTYQVVALFQRTAHKSKDDRRRDMVKLLDSIGKKLVNGSYPLYSAIPGAESLFT